MGKYPAVSFQKNPVPKSSVPKICKPEIGDDNIIRADGVILGKLIPERKIIQLKDHNSYRNVERGTCLVEISIEDLISLCEKLKN